MAIHDHDRILVFLRWGIGDLLLQWPVLEHLREMHPNAHRTFIGAEPALQLLEGSGIPDEIRSYQEFGIDHMGGGSRKAVREVGRWLEAEPFDAVADALAAPLLLRRVAWRNAKAHYYETDRAATAAALSRGEDGGRALAAGAVAGWGLPAFEPPAEVRVPVADHGAAAGRLLRRLSVSGDGVALVPFASHPLKRWPEERFLVLVEYLRSEGLEVLVLEAPGDGSAERIVREWGRDGVRLVPPQHLRTTGALLRSVRLTIGNDTGLLHLSAAVGTPALSLFGPSDARVYAPGARADLALRADTECSHRQDRSLSPPGCWTSDHCLIAERSCIEDIAVEAVLRKVETALGLTACMDGG